MLIWKVAQEFSLAYVLYIKYMNNNDGCKNLAQWLFDLLFICFSMIFCFKVTIIKTTSDTFHIKLNLLIPNIPTRIRQLKQANHLTSP